MFFKFRLLGTKICLIHISVCHAPAPPQAPPVLQAMISSDVQNDGVRFCVLEYAIPGSVRKDPNSSENFSTVEYVLALTAC